LYSKSQAGVLVSFLIVVMKLLLTRNPKFDVGCSPKI
jgi:hypothetical protein